MNARFPDVIKCEFTDFKLALATEQDAAQVSVVQFKADKQGRINAPDFVVRCIDNFLILLAYDIPARMLEILDGNRSCLL